MHSDTCFLPPSSARSTNLGPMRFPPSSPSPHIRTPALPSAELVLLPPGALPPPPCTSFGIDNSADEDPRYALFRDRAAHSETRLQAVLRGDSVLPRKRSADEMADVEPSAPAPVEPPRPVKRIARDIDEDDYGDDDDDADEETESRGRGSQKPYSDPSLPVPPNPPSSTSPRADPSLRSKPGFHINTLPPYPSPLSRVAHLARPGPDRQSDTSEPAKSPEAIRLQLEKDKRALEDQARKTCYTLYYTLETDRDALLEQQKLDELDRQIEKEMSAQAAAAASAGLSKQKAQAGTLSQSNLGASNLTLKHLIARIDASRHLVNANDAQLRSLISEVKKNRSKWASEDKIGQEELYESAERVLIELKALTEYASPFLQRVNKRDAPDYFSVIKTPMDIGTMLKRLKSLHYKSKKEFVDDLYLIWDNCMKYNRDPNHILRKKAVHMKKQTDKLVRLIPDIVIRDRAEVEAEERRLQNQLTDGAEESDDEPIMASRGRKAPGKSRKNTTTPRRASSKRPESTPDRKPPSTPFSSRTEMVRTESEAPDEFPISQTPLQLGDGLVLGSQSDPSDPDGPPGLHDMQTGHIDDADVDDAEYNAWKQVTKQYRASVAAERNRLFRGSRLNVDEPALLRTQAGMRRWLRGRKIALQDSNHDPASNGDLNDSPSPVMGGATLAQNIEEDDSAIPDYYDVLAGIPDLEDRLKWELDHTGQVIDQSEECLRVLPKGHFTAPPSLLAKKMDINMRRMQDTRKICAKIAIVKQMQVQSQTYQNQFQKYDPQEFIEKDIEPHVMSDDGPVMCPVPCRAALQRSVAKIFYHSGFEEYQPSALDAVTDIAGQYFQNLVKTLKGYFEAPKVKSETSALNPNPSPRWQPRFTKEECTLLALADNGTDIGQLETYVRDEMDRLRQKLDVMHDRMKSFYTELLRPAMDPNHGPDGVGAFADGSDQFLSGDFAEDFDEDFFGFRELGLDREFGFSFLSVPLHLLQNRLYQGFQSLQATAGAASGLVMEQPRPYDPITKENVKDQIGLVQPFFLLRLKNSKDATLVEDDDLPLNHRFPKPRLPPNGKITCPRKRPIREQQQMARKKKQQSGKDASAGPPGNANSNGAANAAANPNGPQQSGGTENENGKLRFNFPASSDSSAPSAATAVTEPPSEHAAKPEDSPMVGMMSPESI